VKILKYEQTVGSLPAGSAHKFSELSKYQSVKTSGAQKSNYMCYTSEQIQLANKLKSFEARHAAKSKQLTRDQLVAEEAIRQRRQMQRDQTVRSTLIAGRPVNLAGSVS